MRRVPKTLAAALVAFLLAVGVAACGGGDDSDSTATEAAGQQQSQADNAPPGSDQRKGGGSGESDSSDGNSDGGEQSPDSSDFVPKQHSDSGGGSEQFKVKGGDNSVQEFGAEADTAEFDAAATTVHNFLDAQAQGNWAAACGYISKTITESLEKLAAKAKAVEDKSCAGVLAKLVNPAARGTMKSQAEEADVRSMRTDGDRAFVLYTDSEGSVFSMPMANEDGTWKVASLAGYPLS